MNKITKYSLLLTIATAANLSAQTITAAPTYGSFVITSPTTATQTITWAPATLSGSYTAIINHTLNTAGVAGSYSLSLGSSSRLGIAGTAIENDALSITSSWDSNHTNSTGPAAGWTWINATTPAANLVQFDDTGSAVQADLVLGDGSFILGGTPVVTDFIMTGKGPLESSDVISFGKARSSWAAEAVPEPSSSLLIATAGLIGLVRRKR